MTKVGPVTVRTPESDNGDVLKGAAFVAHLRKVQKSANAAGDALLETYVIVRRGIMKSGKRYFAGMDVKYKAYRVTRPIKHMAECRFEQARAASLAILLYQGAFADATIERVKAGEFDPLS